MNSNLCLHDLLAEISKESGVDSDRLEVILNSCFALMAQKIAEGETVVLDGIGTFNFLVNSKGEKQLRFISSEELIEKTNKPFSVFQAVELKEKSRIPDVKVIDSVTGKILEEPINLKETTEPVLETKEEVESDEVEKELTQEGHDFNDFDAFVNDEHPSSTENTAERESIPENENSTIDEDIEEMEEEDFYERLNKNLKKRKTSRFMLMLEKNPSLIFVFGGLFFFLILVASFLVYATFFDTSLTSDQLAKVEVLRKRSREEKQERDRIFKDSLAMLKEKIKHDSILNKIQEEAAAEIPSPTVSHQKISQPIASVNESSDFTNKVIGEEKIIAGVTLTKLAKKYYGNKIFWVYLFDFNKVIIENPNSIAIGTIIKIPKKEIYHIDATDSQAIEKAKKRQRSILKNFSTNK